MNPDELQPNCAVVYYKAYTGDLISFQLYASNLKYSTSLSGEIEISMQGYLDDESRDKTKPKEITWEELLKGVDENARR